MRLVRNVTILVLLFIGSIWLGLAAAATVTAHMATNTTETSWSGMVTLASYVSLLAALGLFIFIAIRLIVRRKRKRRLEQRREGLRYELVKLDAQLQALRPLADEHDQVYRHYALPKEFWRSAQLYFVLSELDTAEDLIKQVQKHIYAAWQAANAVSKVDAIRVHRLDDTLALISTISHQPQEAESDSHRHYYNGGRIGKVTWPAGWYTDPFWTWPFMGSLPAARNDKQERNAFNSVITENNRPKP